MLASSSVSGAVLNETNIVLASDKKKFVQVLGFTYAVVTSTATTCSLVNLPASCKYYLDPKTGIEYLYYYPSDSTVQYLYESYPNLISPILGVTDEHFIAWMKTSALPNFRKLYGRINSDFKKGDVITFGVTANYEVRSFSASKGIVLGG